MGIEIFFGFVIGGLLLWLLKFVIGFLVGFLEAILPLIRDHGSALFMAVICGGVVLGPIFHWWPVMSALWMLAVLSLPWIIYWVSEMRKRKRRSS